MMHSLQPMLDHPQSGFRLNWQGIHGIRHWARVRANGLKLAKETGADAQIVELFAFLHDSCHWNDGHDPQHGGRAAELVRTLQGRFYHLSPDDLDCLAEACTGLTHEATHSNITIATCWDADRLDLGRVGIEPDPARLCTEAARGLFKRCVGEGNDAVLPAPTFQATRVTRPALGFTRGTKGEKRNQGKPCDLHKTWCWR